MRRLTLLFAGTILLAGCIPSQLMKPDDNAVLIDWEVTELAPGEFDQPNFELALTLSRGSPDRVPLESYAGSFADGRESPVVSGEAASGALLTGAAWWAGAGDEFIVRRADNGYLEIWHRAVEEQVEPGEFTLLRTVGIPPEIEVRATE